MKGNGGFTLIEALISITVVSIAALGLVHWLQCLYQGFSTNLQNEGALAVAEAVDAALGEDAVHCSPNLKNVNLNLTSPAATGLNSIAAYDDLGKFQYTVVKVGTKAEVEGLGTNTEVAGLTTNSLNLAPLFQIDPTSLVGDLSLNFTKTGVFGPVQIVRHIPVYLTMSGTQVSSCETAPIPSFIIKSRLCEIWSDGYSYYDSNKGDCSDIPGVRYFPGTGTTATCGAGYHFAAYAKDPGANTLVCQTDGAPVGRSLVRSYTNGTTDNSDIYKSSATLNPATNTCTFALPSYTVANGTAGSIPGSIKCYPN
jgi:prepilin-type N-terminal cleavage/methylation domain-containing protein